MIQLAHPPGYRAERHYAARVLLGELLGLQFECVEEARHDVELTLPGEGGALRFPDVLFATRPDDWLSEKSLPDRPLAREEGLPLIYGRDLFGGAFFLLTRYEEAVLPERDEHGRFPASASLAVREDFLERPLVNEYAESLWGALHATWPRLERRHREFRLLPSHDVDYPFCAGVPLLSRLRTAVGDILHRRDPSLALRRAAGADICDTFDFLFDVAEREGVPSTFFFIAGQGPENRIGEGYSLRDPRLRTLLRRIHERGHQIGLHGSYRSYDDASHLEGELATLVAICAEEHITPEGWGGRQHYLRWSLPLWRAYDEIGLAYDSSLSFAERPGFRAGICCEFPVFDLEARRALQLRERPLVAMEGSLLQYMALDEGPALERLLELKRTCRRFSGDFTLLWHNQWLAWRSARRMYRDVIEA